VLSVMTQLTLKGMAHITGGGLVENVPRILPTAVQAVIRREAWPRPAIFDWLQQRGQVEEREMHRVFNCGIGYVVVVSAPDAHAACHAFGAAGETCWPVGTIGSRAPDAPACVIK